MSLRDGKHEALDPSRSFLWFDDDPEDEDLAWLQQNDCQAALIPMDAYNPTNPIVILQTLKRTLPSGMGSQGEVLPGVLAGPTPPISRSGTAGATKQPLIPFD